MMNAALYAGDLTADELDALATALRPQAPHTIVERVDTFNFPGSDEPLQPTRWDEGRIFGPGLELHWARRDGGFRAVLTREDGGDGTGLPQTESLADYERREYTYYLWGEDDVRIGQRLTYGSIPGKGRAQLVVAEFYDQAGELRHWRYVRFQREGEHG
jgi:hypothetical protein